MVVPRMQGVNKLLRQYKRPSPSGTASYPISTSYSFFTWRCNSVVHGHLTSPVKDLEDHFAPAYSGRYAATTRVSFVSRPA